jgi:hypothetical protein
VFLKAPQVRLEQEKSSFGVPRINPRSPQTDYAALLLLYDEPPSATSSSARRRSFSESIYQNNAQAAKQAQDSSPKKAGDRSPHARAH